jgi:hypothetical protein
MNISLKKSLSLLAVGAALALGNAAQAVTFNYASETGANIVFSPGGAFTFSPIANNFQVTSGSANTRLGEVTGNFQIGAISVNGLTSSAPVTGSGSFVIHDGSGFNLSASLTWVNISQTGTSNGLNTVGAVNLTNITYGGVNADLVALAANTTAYNVLTFQFVPEKSLSDLKTNGGSTSFSGTVATNVPDGGTTIALLGLSLAGLALARRKFSV